METSTKNLGPVAGLFIGLTPPNNTTLIWYDSTPAIKCHKVYNDDLGQWVILDNSVISAITYSVLENIAQTQGLTIGQWFKITDRNNVLALAITTTKIQYTDILSNIVVDDLGHNTSYIVSSSNLLIDDIAGVWDLANNKLLFSFNEVTPEFNDNNFIFGKQKVNNVWSLVKFKMTRFISTATGNSLSWNDGLFLNFYSKLSSYFDVSGGVVSKTTYDVDKAITNQNIANTNNRVDQIYDNVEQTVASAVSDASVYGKRLPVIPTTNTPVPIVQYDTLQTIVLKLYSWVNKLMWAVGIRISPNYSEATTYQIVNNNDSVETAIGKLAYTSRYLKDESDKQSDGVVIRNTYSPQQRTIVPGTTNLTQLLEDLQYQINNLFLITQIRVPVAGIIPYYKEVDFDSMFSAVGAGLGWIPCMWLFAGNEGEVNTEEGKWRDKYYTENNVEITFAYNVVNAVTYLRISSCNGIAIPEMSGEFLVGTSKYDNGQSGSISLGVNYGSNSMTLSVNQLPAHSHSCDAAGGHNHTIPDMGGVNAGSGNYKGFVSDLGSGSNTGSAGVHVHNIGSTGGGNPIDKRPYAKGVNYLIRVM